MATLKDASVKLLEILDLPVTENRLVGLVAFGAIEGGHWHNTAKYNFLNTMRDAPGAMQAQGLLKGIKAYRDWDTGLRATAATMVQTNMRPIAEALKNDATPREFLSAVTKSDWCKGCDYTKYNPEQLYRQHANVSDGEAPTPEEALAEAPKGVPWGLIALTGVLVVAGVAGAWYLATEGGKRPLLAAAENPVSRVRGRGGSRVQTLMFPRTKFTPATARSWARRYGYKSGKVDITPSYYRIRQLPPGGRMRTISMGPDVQAVIRFG